MNIITIITTTITTTIMLKKKTFFEGHFWRAQKVDELRIGDPKKNSCQAFGGRMEKKKAMKENLHCVESHEAESALFFGGPRVGSTGPRATDFGSGLALTCS